jgi:hypothetical protein
MTLDEVKELCNKYSLRFEEAGRSGVWYAWSSMRKNYIFGYHASNKYAWGGEPGIMFCRTFDKVKALDYFVKLELKEIKKQYMQQKIERIKDDF